METNRTSGRQPFGNPTEGFSPERRRRVESIKARLLKDARFLSNLSATAAAARKPEDSSG